MISAQKEALEDARQSRENALKATRVFYLSSGIIWRRAYMYFPDQKQLFGFDVSRASDTF